MHKMTGVPIIAGVSCLAAVLESVRHSDMIYNCRHVYQYPIGREYTGVISPLTGSVWRAVSPWKVSARG